ncbi:hypothetical protein KC953_01495 [Candidatus Saccharibacteria bacterium]|nr:hypothetical protein [Candidatus Saccharibacteria bacterium]
MCQNEEQDTGNTPDAPSVANLFDAIKLAIVSGINTEIQRCIQPDSKLRYRKALDALKDASDNIEWIAANELRLFASRAQLIKNDISSIISAHLSQPMSEE